MIINSVIIGSGSGDEVEAYALGDAKNAVKDDKVTLNFSADILPIEESVEESSTREYFFTGYAKNTEAVFLSTSNAYIFKKNPEGVWSRTSATSFGSQGGNKRCSPFGLLIDLYAGKGLKVVNGYPVSLDYNIAGRSYEPRDRALFSTTGEYCAVFSYMGSSRYKTVVYYKNSLLQVLDEWSSSSDSSYPRFFFANKDGVEYLFVGIATATASVQTPHTYRLTPTGAEYLGRFSVSRQNGDNFTIYATASVGDLLLTSSSDDNTTLSSLGMFKTEIDPTQKTVVLKDASKEFTSFNNVVGDSFGFPAGEGLNLAPTGDVNIIQFRPGCIKYNPREGTFEPYLPTGNIRDRVFYNADERVAVKTVDNTLGFSLYRLLQPIEQPYVATTFADRSYCFSSGLTGIVKENNNGILKVSTVEDPNNPPHAVPDEGGLKTTINYGSAGGDFGSVSVGYGYFRNTLTKPSDKYISYDGGMLTEDNIQGSKATTMNIILGRSADMGSWTSDTEGYLSAQDSVVLGVNKKLSTPVYLWHDYSYISPAVPETIEPEVVLGTDEFTPNVTVVGSPTIEGSNVSGFSPTSYVHCGTPYKSTNNAKYVVEFTTGNSISSEQPFLHCEYLFALSIEKNNTMVSYSWGNGSYATVLSTLSPNTRYRVELVANGTNRTITATNLSGGESNTITQADSKIDVSAAYNVCFGAFSTGSTSGYFEGTIHLDTCYIDIDDQRVWDGVVYDPGTVSLPVSWKNIDGVLYEYPNGFPKTKARDLEVNVVEGSNNLYATRTGDTCGLVISSTSPVGVDSSAVIGTVELDANGVIVKPTSDDTVPAPTTIYIDNRDVSDQVEVVRLPDGSGYAAKVPNTATYRRYTVDSSSSEAAYWGVGIDPSDISLNLRGSEISFSESNIPSAYLYVVNSDSLNGVRTPYEGHLHITDDNYAPAG